MKTIEQATEEYISVLLESEIYQNYQDELRKVKAVPGLKEQIDEFRSRNFVLQSGTDIDFDKLDRFEKEYESFREQTLVSDFLAAELELCRMVQRITVQITEGLQFE